MFTFSDFEFYNGYYEQYGGHEYFPLDNPKCEVRFSDTTPGCNWKTWSIIIAIVLTNQITEWYI